MTYDIENDPTDYAGVRFRSQLEAIWAAFFDIHGWRWRYEPWDMRDSGWLPDFDLMGTPAEVKPVGTRGIVLAYEAAFEKAIRPYWTILFGARPVGPDMGCIARKKDRLERRVLGVAFGRPVSAAFEVEHEHPGAIDLTRSWQTAAARVSPAIARLVKREEEQSWRYGAGNVFTDLEDRQKGIRRCLRTRTRDEWRDPPRRRSEWRDS